MLLSLTRPAASVRPAPLVRALLDGEATWGTRVKRHCRRVLHACEVSFRTQRVAAVSVVRFRIRLVTAVPAPRGALLIQGPEADTLNDAEWHVMPSAALGNAAQHQTLLRASSSRSSASRSTSLLRPLTALLFEAWDTRLDWMPSAGACGRLRLETLPVRGCQICCVLRGDGGIGCTFFRLSGVPRIQLQPGTSSLLAGLYLFELPVQNPAPQSQRFHPKSEGFFSERSQGFAQCRNCSSVCRSLRRVSWKA